MVLKLSPGYNSKLLLLLSVLSFKLNFFFPFYRITSFRTRHTFVVLLKTRFDANHPLIF